MKFANDNTKNKLILLFIFDKMEIALKEETVLEMCMQNDWLTYMDCVQALSELDKANFIYNTTNRKKDKLYSLTPEGRVCLAHFYDKIPASLRGNIVDYIKQYCLTFKRRQEYSADYKQNEDGSYRVMLKIEDAVQPMMELAFRVEDRDTAKAIYAKWEQMAATVYASIAELLLE